MIDFCEVSKIIGGRKVVGEDWVSPSKLRPLSRAIDDPCLVWLDLGFGHEYDLHRDEEPYSLFSHICKLGNEFESAWMQHEAPDAVRALDDDRDARKVVGFLRTIELLQGDNPCLSHVALWHGDGMFGSADIVCKASWLYGKYPQLRPDVEEPDHWLPVELKLTRNLESPAKRGDLEIYRNQLAFYAGAIQAITGQKIPRAYIVTPDRLQNPVCVHLDATEEKKLEPELMRMRQRYLEIKSRGADLRPWSHNLVRPNFGNSKSDPWTTAKQKIAERHMEGLPLEYLPRVGATAASSLRSRGFQNISDLMKAAPQSIILTELSGIGPSSAARLECVIRANRNGSPTKIKRNSVPNRGRVEAFVDFEFINGGLAADYTKNWPNCRASDLIFMIGVGWLDADKWQYQEFIAPTPNADGERIAVDEFLDCLYRLGALGQTNSTKIWHWSPAEPAQCIHASKRLNIPQLAELGWADLQKVMLKAELALPGAYGSGLKETMTALASYAPEYGISWDEELHSGGSAMVMGLSGYATGEIATSAELPILSRYLQSDVRSMERILSWLRYEAGKEQTPKFYDRDGDRIKRISAVGRWYVSTGPRRSVEVLRHDVMGWYPYAYHIGESVSRGA